MKHIMKCPNCGRYTMKAVCDNCGEKTVTPVPPKYSPDDKFGEYRRRAKRQMFEKEGLL